MKEWGGGDEYFKYLELYRGDGMSTEKGEGRRGRGQRRGGNGGGERGGKQGRTAGILSP